MKTLNNTPKVLKISGNLVLSLLFSALMFGCGSNAGNENASTASDNTEQTQENTEELTEELTDPMDNKGVGPVDHVDLGPIDVTMAAEGKVIFEENCTACHQLEDRYVGPALKEITARRSPEWIMNMIMNPNEMVQKDPVAKALLAEYLSPMANQNISREDARRILEYFRSVDEVK
ncbi:cytochrome c [Catalinimonas alkaloidigena]|uniref:c-type cytochrome n=1 Tax=Catalinimonas alkaloidigena TaxID=1075417 RepID=UPI0024071E4B|nr:cytochrome c [Catalinimonas alkaloidigena]MDF9801337.1 cytochrome c [Catalinimonas alkaloidigena]